MRAHQDPMKPRQNKMSGGTLFYSAGWLLAILLSCWAAPRVYHRLVTHLPGYQRGSWGQTLADKQRALSSRWLDPRPLIIFAGDSQTEFGNWYDLFGGAWAVRNCGLAAAKIADVTQLVPAIGDPHPQTVVLWCGSNNLGHHDRRDACLRDYEALLAAVRLHLHPESILVLSVMPVRESAVDRAAHQFNGELVQFNRELAACCRQHQVEFLEVTSAVAGENGGLAEALTVDGLHLNAEGYRRLAQIIAPELTTLMHAP